MSRCNCNPQLSIVVPIYNGETVINRCVDSILGQSFLDFELLLVNDGSKDKTRELCNKYEQKDERIRVINKKNEGVSATRNRGIQEAVGVYIAFVDCDDYVDKHHFERMVSEMQRKAVDLVIGGYTRHKSGMIDTKAPKCAHYNSFKEFSEDFFGLYNSWFLNTPWNKLYKREKIEQYFPLELSLGEDLVFNLEYLKKCNEIEVIDEVGYQYFIMDNTNSLSIQYREDYFANSCYLHGEVISFAKEYLGLTNELSWNDEAFVKGIRFAMTNMMRTEQLSNKEKKKRIAEIVQEEEVQLAYKRCKSMTLLDKIFSILVRHKWNALLYALISIKD